MRGARAASGGLLSRTPMTAPLTPALALAYLSELSADIRAAIVLDAGGDVLAVSGREVPSPGADASAPGDDSRPAVDIRLAKAARALLAGAPVVRALTERG